MSSAKTDAWVADIGIGVGAVAIAAGAYLFITGGNTDKTPKSGARVRPLVGGSPTGFSTGVGGAF
jgi:hypothetical protein